MLTIILSLLFTLNLHADVTHFSGTGQGDDRYAGPIGQPINPPPPANPPSASYFDWGLATTGYAYCYEWSNSRMVTGNPVANYICDQRNPSYYFWGQGYNGWGACYQFTPAGYVLNTGYPVANFNCEQVARSYFRWSTGFNGWNYCYQFTSNGYVMNYGQPVAPGYCY